MLLCLSQRCPRHNILLIVFCEYDLIVIVIQWTQFSAGIGSDLQLWGQGDEAEELLPERGGEEL